MYKRILFRLSLLSLLRHTNSFAPTVHNAHSRLYVFMSGRSSFTCPLTFLSIITSNWMNSSSQWRANSDDVSNFSMEIGHVQQTNIVNLFLSLWLMQWIKFLNFLPYWCGCWWCSCCHSQLFSFVSDIWFSSGWTAFLLLFLSGILIMQYRMQQEGIVWKLCNAKNWLFRPASLKKIFKKKI